MKNIVNNGVLLMFLSTVFFSLMSLFAKIVTKELHPSEVALIRFLITVVAISLFFWYNKSFKIVNKKMWIIRGLFGGMAILLYLLSFLYIPLGRALLLTYTYPISATILAHFILKERIKKGAIFALITAVIGLIIITSFDVTKFLVGDILGVLSGVCAGIAVTSIRKLRQTDSSWSITYSLGVFGVLVSAPLTIINFQWPSNFGWVLLILVALFSIIAQYTMTYAYKFCKTSTGSIISLTTVVLGTFLGVVFLGETLSPNFIIGGLLVLVSIVYIIEIKNIGKFLKRISF